MKQVVVGLAGHIDHGKTSIIRALTGVNTDSLIEEQKRGMTIDIGFAFLTETITLIDVPGHEKFVKNMMAGVSAIDVALLVVSADDSIMPQTREHFEILNLLGITSACVVINKIDLVDQEWQEMVVKDLRQLIENSFMKNVSIISVSAKTGQGIDNLKNELLKICKIISKKYDRGIFRLNIDRVFTKKGHGNVVTGTVISGIVKTGDNLEVLPGKIKCRVRGLQTHGDKINSLKIGDRAAINLQGVEKEYLVRGSQLSTPGYFSSVMQLGVELKLLKSYSKSLIQNQRIRVHLGTQEVMARIAIIGKNKLDPGEEIVALLKLETELVASRSDKFIIRSFSPVVTIGGGKVLELKIEGKWKSLKDKLKNLYGKNESKQLLQIVEQSYSKPLTLKQLKIRLGLSETIITNWISNEKGLFWVSHNNNKWLLSNKQRDLLVAKIINFLNRFHNQNPFKSGVQKENIRQFLDCDESFLDSLLSYMLKENMISQNGMFWSDPSFVFDLSLEDQKIQNSIIQILEQEGFSSSSAIELINKTGYDKNKLMQILNVSEQEGKILRIDTNLMFSKNNFHDLKNKVILHFKSNSTLSISEFKELANTSRKYAVPLLEYFDKQKITYREGNIRKLVV